MRPVLMDQTTAVLPEQAGEEKLALPMGQYRVWFRAAGAGQCSGYLGSAVRGAFGHALKKAVCVTQLKRCEPCLLYRTCPYAYIFETPPPPDAGKMRLYKAAPHPYVFDLAFPDQKQSATGRLEIGFTLFGRGNQYLPYVLHALEEAGRRGIGRSRTELTLETVEQRTDWTKPKWKVIYQPGERLEAEPPSVPEIPLPGDLIRIEIETPLRLKFAEQIVKPGDLRFSNLFIALMRRISMLTYFHTDAPHETDFRALVSDAHEVELLAKDLQWHDLTRYSSRQKTAMQMGGLLGSVELERSGIEKFWPYLWLGQWAHAGKGTSMGLGRYRLVAASLRAGTVSGE